MSAELSTVIAGWTMEEKRQAFALLLKEICPPEVSSETKSSYWAKIRERLQPGRSTLSEARFIRGLDRMDSV